MTNRFAPATRNAADSSGPDPDAAPGGRPLITVAVPSLNQGQFIGRTLESILSQPLPTTVNVMDAGSSDGTMDVVNGLRDQLGRVRSHPDAGQAAAINEGLAGADSAYVAWLNADDEYLPGGLQALVSALESAPGASFAYGRTVLQDGGDRPLGEYAVEPWNLDRFARKCFVSQPATLIRTSAWRKVGGLDTSLHMALDYDLWWRLAAQGGQPVHVNVPVAMARFHPAAKTMSRPMDHYREAMAVVRRHYGRVPLWWWVKMPVSVGSRKFLNKPMGQRRHLR